MIASGACWSRMLSRLRCVRKTSLARRQRRRTARRARATIAVVAQTRERPTVARRRGRCRGRRGRVVAHATPPLDRRGAEGRAHDLRPPSPSRRRTPPTSRPRASRGCDGRGRAPPRARRRSAGPPCPRGEVDDQLVDRALGADVDAARRLVGDQHPRRVGTATCANSTFCWLPPDSVRDRRRGPRGRTPRRSISSSTRRALRRAVDAAEPPRRVVEVRRASCSRRTERSMMQPLVLAVLGQHRDAGSRSPRAASRARRAARRRARSRRASRGRRRRSARASSVRPLPTRPGEPDDLARARTSSDDVARRRRAREAPDREHDRRVAATGALGGNATSSGGRASPSTSVSVRLVRRRRGPHDARRRAGPSPCRRREHLVEEVRDVDDRSMPALAQAADRLEQAVGLVRGQRRGRLVHHDQARVAGERAQDLDLLLVGERAARRPGVRAAGRTRRARSSSRVAARAAAPVDARRAGAARCRGRRSRSRCAPARARAPAR